MSFKDFKIHLYFSCLPTSQPAIRPSSARCIVPEISDSQGNGSRFMNLLIVLIDIFVHCVMVIPFILHNPFLFFCIPLNKVRSPLKKVLIGSQLLFVMSHKTMLAHVTTINNVITDMIFLHVA